MQKGTFNFFLGSLNTLRQNFLIVSQICTKLNSLPAAKSTQVIFNAAFLLFRKRIYAYLSYLYFELHIFNLEIQISLNSFA